jgi:hypothetical protein
MDVLGFTFCVVSYPLNLDGTKTAPVLWGESEKKSKTPDGFLSLTAMLQWFPLSFQEQALDRQCKPLQQCRCAPLRKPSSENSKNSHADKRQGLLSLFGTYLFSPFYCWVLC